MEQGIGTRNWRRGQRVREMETREAVGNKVGWWSVLMSDMGKWMGVGCGLVVFDKTAVGGKMGIRE
jgi:hypothetical protein